MCIMFESSVNSYDSQTARDAVPNPARFESSVNSYDSQTSPPFLYYNLLV